MSGAAWITSDPPRDDQCAGLSAQPGPMALNIGVTARHLLQGL